MLPVIDDVQGPIELHGCHLTRLIGSQNHPQKNKYLSRV